MILKSTSAGFYSKRVDGFNSTIFNLYFVTKFMWNNPRDLFTSNFSLKIITFDGNETFLQCSTGNNKMKKFDRQTSTKTKTRFVKFFQQRKICEEKNQCQTIVEIFQCISKRWITKNDEKSSFSLKSDLIQLTVLEQHDRVCIQDDCFELFLHEFSHFVLLLWLIVEDKTKDKEKVHLIKFNSIDRSFTFI